MRWLEEILYNSSGTGMLILAFAAFALVMVAMVRLPGLLRPLPPLERRDLLTGAETRFLSVLRSAFPQYLIMSQISMGALLKPRSGLDRSDWWKAYNGIAQKRVDFALCDVAGRVLVLVELDDSTHDAGKDRYRDKVLGLGGYPVARFHVRPWPTVAFVRERINGILGGVARTDLSLVRRAG